MKNTAIIIPSRLGAKRFPNKPLEKINNTPMIIHVLNRAKESNVGKVYVATPDKEIFDIVKKNAGNVILTSKNHISGSDRIYEVYLTKLKNTVDLIINLQGDMPNIKPDAISHLEKLMRNHKCDLGTLASNILDKNDITNSNVVKVHMNEKLEGNNFLNPKDFFRTNEDLNNKNIYHHIGIYAFTSNSLKKYIGLTRSKLEIERNLEQMRAIENNFIVKVGFCDSSPLGVDTKEDLLKVSREMK